MNIAEYNKVKNLKYNEYCDYLQEKYGLSKYPYFTKNWNKNAKCTRTSEGLACHHKCEDRAIKLSTPEFAKNNPYEFQLPENLVFCDYLEHLFLHILICENPNPLNPKPLYPYEIVGIGGIQSFLVPELNDLYSGWKTNQSWRMKCHALVIDDEDVYLELIKRFKHNCNNYPLYNADDLCSSYNNRMGVWDDSLNEQIYKKIKNL